MAIYNGYTITVDFANNTAKINEVIHLYKNDQNIPLYFQFIEKRGTLLSMTEIDILEQMNVTGVKMLILKPDGSEWRSEILHKTQGYIIDDENANEYKMQYILNGQLLDEINEIGEFDLQFRFYNDEEYTISSTTSDAKKITSIITIPCVEKAMYVHEPIIDDNNDAGTGSIGGDVDTDDTVYVAFDSNGIYIPTEWVKRDRLLVGKLNKIETGIKVNSENIKKILYDAFDYSKLENTPRINGVDLNKNSTFKSLGISPSTHNHDYRYAPMTHSHAGMVIDTQLKDYAKINHNHDSQYANINHNHKDEYATVNHTHDYKVVSEGSLSSVSNLKRSIFTNVGKEYKNYKIRLSEIDTNVVPSYINLYIDIDVDGTTKTLSQQISASDGNYLLISIEDLCGYYVIKFVVLTKSNSYTSEYTTSHFKTYVGGNISNISLQANGLVIPEYQVFAK